jgi:eukaryotic-like serine/threonine-protein kinase
MGGHIKEGIDQIRAVLAAVGFTFPAGPRRALLSLLMKRVQIRVRGLGFKERDISEISESDLVRIDTCWAAAAGLGLVDLIRGADFQSRHLLLALRAGEPYRVARAMAFEAAQIASRGGKAITRANEVARRAEELSRRVGHPHAIGLSIWASGVTAYLSGNWRKAAELCERAAEVLRDKCTGVPWELTIAQRFMLSALLHQGEIAEVFRRVPGLLSAALDQGNLFAATDLRTRLNLIWLAQDDPDKARAEVIEALKAWPQEGFHLQHYSSLHALVQNELYTGDAEVAWKHVEGQWPGLESSMLLRFQILRIEATHLRARAALATAAIGHGSEKLRLAEKLAHKMEKEKVLWAQPFLAMIRAGVAQQRSQTSATSGLLKKAIKGFEDADMRLYAAAARRRLGETTQGQKGSALVAEADAWMANQGIVKPELITRMLAPGF